MNPRCILFFLLAIGIQCFAVPAFNKKVKIAVEDGYVYITLHGDENCKYGTTESGYTVLQSAAGWYYACEDEDGNVACSAYKLKKEQDSETAEFLKSVPKRIRPTAETEKSQRAKSTVYSGTQKSVGINSITGTRRVLVILMQYTDKSFTKTTEDFNDLFNKEGYNHDGANGSIYDFYKKSSFGQLELFCDITGPYTTNYSMSYYGANTGSGSNDIRPKALFDEALEKASQEINLQNYDCDGDGYIDNIHIIYAGYGEEAGAPSNTIWAHEMTFSPISIQGMLIDRYSCSPELRGNQGTGITRIGAPCHEIGHALGAMDYYDTNYQTGGNFTGTGEWDLMAQGSWNNDGISPADFNPYVKAYNFGWCDVTTLQADTIIEIKSCNTKNNIYRIDTPVEGEFFLLENRRKNELNTHIPSEGLLIYHIDASIEKKALTNTINAGYPQACYPVCASSAYKITNSSPASYGDINSTGCPFPGTSGKTVFSDTSTPAAVCTDGTSADFTISDIKETEETIQLSFSCEQTNNDESSDEDIIWTESFETTPLSNFWAQEAIEGNSKWSTIISLSTSGNNYAADGKGYAVFEATSTQSLFASRVKGRLVSSSITLPEESNYTLNLFYSRKAKNSTADTLQIYTRESSNDEWEKGSLCIIEKDEVWENVQMELPSAYTQTEIAIDGNINISNTLQIDAISILRKESETTNVKNIDESEKSLSVLYDATNSIKLRNNTNYRLKIRIISANGFYTTETLAAKEEKTIFLKGGLYIIHDGQTTHKAFIK